MAELFDVVIVGGGGSCLAAAVSAAEQGLRVMVLEKEAALGGTTAIAVGSFTACQTELQRNVGIDDNVDEHAEDAGRFAPPRIEACNNDELRRWFLSQSAETLIWLQGIGLSFTGPSPEPIIHPVIDRKFNRSSGQSFWVSQAAKLAHRAQIA